MLDVGEFFINPYSVP